MSLAPSTDKTSSPLPASPDAGAFLALLRGIVGRRHVLTDDAATRRYRMGYRFGGGRVLAVVRPGSLVEQWRVAQAAVAAGKIIIMQAANTGLTGGSTPDGDAYDRDIILINCLRLRKVQLIQDGRQVICLPGATLDQLEKLLKPLGREPHSVIGSSCIGASVFGGIANNSGGSLVQRGPAYTELSLFGQVGADGVLRLVNHLGVTLPDDPEQMLARLEAGAYAPSDIDPDAGAASDRFYKDHVRDIDADSPARFNADPSRLREVAGCAGKLLMFAVRLDTFPAEPETRVFYIGSNQPQTLTGIRRHILSAFKHMPVAGEYMHRAAYDIAEHYGKDTFLAINHFGTARMPFLFGLKSRFDALADRLGFLPAHLSDRVLQAISQLFPPHLPRRMADFRDRYEHHLILKVAGPGIAETAAFLKEFFQSAEGAYFECTAEEGAKAFLHRFAAAGAAIRYRAIHARTTGGLVALDVALRRNDADWVEQLPAELDRLLPVKLYYGHFLCHVFHQDYIVAPGCDPLAIEHQMWTLLDARRAEYPAEHNVGHLYQAKPALRAFYKALDPCNCLNPGIGQTSKAAHWAGDGADTAF